MTSAVLYHVVYAREGLSDAMVGIHELIRHAIDNEMTPRVLTLDIEGHRNSEGGFDDEMFALQKEVLLGDGHGWLGYLAYLDEATVPLYTVRNEKARSDDLPTKPPKVVK